MYREMTRTEILYNICMDEFHASAEMSSDQSTEQLGLGTVLRVFVIRHSGHIKCILNKHKLQKTRSLIYFVLNLNTESKIFVCLFTWFALNSYVM
jgi:hypothetical protein